MQKTQNKRALVWFRNDLRILDQSSLSMAVSKHKTVMACYCFDPRHFEIGPFGFKKTERFRAQFLIETVVNLKANLKKIGIELFVFHEHPEVAIPKLATQHDISSIYFQKEWTSEELTVSNDLRLNVPETIDFHEQYDQFLYHPNAIQLCFDELPKVFTNFRMHLEQRARVEPYKDCPIYCGEERFENNTQIPSLKDLGLASFKKHPHTAFPFQGGESSAIDRLNAYVYESKKLAVYKKTRNGLIGVDYSSKFSAWLANGSLSPRVIYWTIKDFEKNHQKNDSTYWLIFELIWRDFFKYIALKHGSTIFKIGGILNKDYEWSTNKQSVESWIEGRTNEDFVNANMKEFKLTGWMSNRGRQNVASYFAKELKLDWRIGASYFESLLLDYDVHSNYGNWMYVAGVGNDPRDRTFNISSQAKRYDGQGNYRRLWLQETLF